MLKQHARAVDLGTRFFDLIALIAAAPLAYALYLALSPPGHDLPLERYWPALVFVLLAWIAAASAFRVYDTFRTRPITVEVGRLARAMGLVGLILIAIAFLAHAQWVSRLFVTMYLALSFAVIATARAAVRRLARAFRRRGYNTRRFAIVGTGDAAEEVVETFSQHPQWGYELVGFVLRRERDAAPENGRVLGTVAQLGTILENHVLDEVVFAVPRDELSTIDAAVLLCEEQGVAVRVCLDALRVGDAEMSLLELAGMPMLVFTRTSSDLLSLAAKRAFDVAVSTAVLLLLAPVFAVIALAVRFESPGPVLFRQRRMGLNGREFWMWKFRSMYVDAEQRLEALRAQNEMSGPVFKMANDPRVTRVGRLIRKASLDELPQFWNVLKGEMSVVGPRPPIPAEVRQYKRWQRRRLSVRPGITCTWQVSGRNDIDFEQWMQMDLEYIDHWSLWRDVEICLKTIPAVLTARGAS